MRIFLIFALSCVISFAECFYSLDIDIKPHSKALSVKAKIYDNAKSINLIDYKNFDIKDISKLESSLREGLNKIEFTYEKSYKDRISSDFIMLLDGWIPKTKGLCRYKTKVTLPQGFEVVMETNQVKKSKSGDQNIFEFDIEKPIDHLSLIASKDFKITKEKHENIEISTYLFKKHSHLATRYIKKTKEYIDLYEKMIGKYPYKRFAIVENKFQTGYSMPTFTLIGDRIIDKKYILERSLGHEILHQWFGNSVFSDLKEGNWVEGITAYLSDHRYQEEKKQGAFYRKEMINYFMNYVTADNETALKDFKYRFDKASMSIGYNKGAFLFHMLRIKLGDDLFFATLRNFYAEYAFKKANFKEIKSVFEDYAKEDLSVFFDQWVLQKGIIDFDIKDMDYIYKEGKFHLSFNIEQRSDFLYDLPLEIVCEEEMFQKKLNISKKTQKFAFELNSKPIEVTFDKNYDLFRKLSSKERIFNIARIKTLPKIFAVGAKEGEKNSIKKIFPTAVFIDKKDANLKKLKEENILFTKSSKDIAFMFSGDFRQSKKDTIQILKNPRNDEKAFVLFDFKEAIDKNLQRRLKYYEKYSKLYLDGAKVVKKEIQDTQNGIVFDLSLKTHIIPVKKSISFDKMIDDIKNKKFIYVGETHDRYSHHINQLKVVKALHQKGIKIAIGMEMFQYAFQNVVNSYLEGKINLKEFLKKSEYFKRWGFEYDMYKPIIDFAKENNIPVIALNIEKEITKKVSSKGLLALNKEDRKKLPKGIDFSKKEYEKYLTGMFSGNMHKTKKGRVKNAEFFYQAQLLWDETMAYNSVQFFKKHPDTTVVVLAGSGHMMSGFGIPGRVYRRTKEPYSVILNDVQTRANVADYVLFNPRVKSVPSKKIGVYLESSKGLLVSSVVKGSLAEEKGIKKGDILLEINGKKIKDLNDIKFHLYFYKEKKAIKITIKRGKKTLVL